METFDFGKKKLLGVVFDLSIDHDKDGNRYIDILKLKLNNKVYDSDENLLVFVALHELGHVMTKSTGHTEEFWDNFRFLLKESIKIGVYKRQDFKKNPQKYCGTKITDSPLDE